MHSTTGDTYWQVIHWEMKLLQGWHDGLTKMLLMSHFVQTDPDEH
jgi:hypothetical protein